MGVRLPLRRGVIWVDLDTERLAVDGGAGVLLRFPGGAADGPDAPDDAILQHLGLAEGSEPLDRRDLLRAAGALGVTAVLLPGAADAASTVTFTSATGAVDLGFDARIGGDPTHRVDAIAVRGDGRILVAGTFTQVGSTSLADVALLGTDGSVADGFEPYSAYSGWTSAGAYAALDTGTALIVGASYSSLAVTDADPNVVDLGGPLFEVGTDGTASPVLADGTDNPSDRVEALAVDASGRILVGGMFENIALQPIPALARLHANGAVDTTFGPFDSDEDLSPRVGAIAVLPDGRIAIGGDFVSVGGVSRPNSAILEANGALANGLQADLDGNVNALAVDRNNGILVGGSFSFVDGNLRVGLARYHGNGALDTGFASSIDTGTVEAIAVQADGRILVGGWLSAGDPTFFESANRIDNLVRLESDGRVDRTLPDLDLDGAVHAIHVAASGAILIGGDFTEVDGVTRNHLARLV